MRSLLVLVMLFTLSAAAQVEPRAEFKQMAQEMVTDLRIQLATVPGAKLKQEILTLVFEAADEEERPVDEIFVDEINKLEIRSIADLDKLQPLLAVSLQRLSAEETSLLMFARLFRAYEFVGGPALKFLGQLLADKLQRYPH